MELQETLIRQFLGQPGQFLHPYSMLCMLCTTITMIWKSLEVEPCNIISTWPLKFWWLRPCYTIKHSRGNLSRFVNNAGSYNVGKTFRGLLNTAYFSVLITNEEIFSGKTFAVSKNPESFPPRTFAIYAGMHFYYAACSPLPMQVTEKLAEGFKFMLAAS